MVFTYVAVASVKGNDHMNHHCNISKYEAKYIVNNADLNKTWIILKI